MVFSKEMLEYLHDSGQMPDWIYYQQNGKSIEENYRDIMNKRQRKYRQDLELQEYKCRRDKEIDKKLEEQLENKLEKMLDNILDDLLKDFQ